MIQKPIDTKKLLLAIICLALFFSGCAKMKLKDDGVSFGNDTSATMDELGVGVIKSKF